MFSFVPCVTHRNCTPINRHGSVLFHTILNLKKKLFNDIIMYVNVAWCTACWCTVGAKSNRIYRMEFSVWFLENQFWTAALFYNANIPSITMDGWNNPQNGFEEFSQTKISSNCYLNVKIVWFFQNFLSLDFFNFLISQAFSESFKHKNSCNLLIWRGSSLAKNQFFLIRFLFLWPILDSNFV